MEALSALNGWKNSRVVYDLRRHYPHCDVTVILQNMAWIDMLFNKECWSVFIQYNDLVLSYLFGVNSLGPSDAYMRQ